MNYTLTGMGRSPENEIVPVCLRPHIYVCKGVNKSHVCVKKAGKKREKSLVEQMTD